MFRIDVIGMRFIDQAALNLLRENINPQTNRSRLNNNQLAACLSVHFNTATRITNRLEHAGHIIKHRTRGRGGVEIEVCAQSAN